LEGIKFSLKSVRGAPSGEAVLKRVTLVVGSEERGTFKVSQALAAMYIANCCNDIHIAFRKSFGLPASKVFEGGGEMSLGDSKFELSHDGILLRRVKLPWEYMYYFPALRSVALTTLARMAKLPVHFGITASAFVEAMPSPIRLFLESVAGADICSYDYLTINEQIVKKLVDAEAATLGKVDSSLLNIVSTSVKPNSLVVVEEPGIFKTLKDTMGEVEKFLKIALEKDLTVFIATSRLAPIYALNEMVEKGIIKAGDISAYVVEGGELKKMDIVEKVGISLDKLKFVAELAE